MKSLIPQMTQNLQRVQKKKPEEQLQQILTCNICYTLAKNILMCPHCSKIYCQNCIKKSLTIKHQCPHCRKRINDCYSMANCERFINQVKQIVEEVFKQRQKQNFKCSQHNVALNYYCIQCKRPVCCECKMFGYHKQHEFIQMQKKYQQKYEQIRQLLAKFKILIKQKQQKTYKLQKLLSQITNKYQQQLIEIDKLQKYSNDTQFINTQKQKEQYQQNLKKLQNFLQKINQLQKTLIDEKQKRKKNKFYAYEEHFISKIKDSIQTINSDVQQIKKNTLEKPSYLSNLIPAYDFHTFQIENFSEKQIPNKAIFSDPVTILDCNWKLKIYPNGNQANKGKYFSIYIMMISNNKIKNVSQTINESKNSIQNIYEYEIALVPNQTQFLEEKTNFTEQNTQNQKKIAKSKEFSREYSSVFQPGSSWGYNKYIQINQLQKQGFAKFIKPTSPRKQKPISLKSQKHILFKQQIVKPSQPQDKLMIRYGIRCPSYYFQYRRLLNEINAVDLQLQQYEGYENPSVQILQEQPQSFKLQKEQTCKSKQKNQTN